MGFGDIRWFGGIGTLYAHLFLPVSVRVGSLSISLIGQTSKIMTSLLTTSDRTVRNRVVSPWVFSTAAAFLFVFVVGIGQSAALAQSERALPLAVENDELGVTSNVDKLTVLEQGLTLNVTCTEDVDCRSLTFEAEDDDDSMELETDNSTSESVTVSVNKDKVGSDLVITSTDVDGGISIPIRVPQSEGETDDGDSEDQSSSGGAEASSSENTRGSEGKPSTGESIREVLGTDCTAKAFQNPQTEAFENRFIVSPTGQVYKEPSGEINEEERVTVQVVADRALIGRLVVKRTSAFQQPGVIRIAGGDAKVPTTFEPQGVEDQDRCEVSTFVLSDFAAGRGEVTISVIPLSGDRSRVETGTFDFSVRSLYTGAFTFGAVNTQLSDPRFGTVSTSGGQRVTITEDAGSRVMYVLGYTPFVWGKRTLADQGIGIRRFNPFVAVSLNDLDMNALVGVSFDFFGGLYVQGGYHVGRVERIDPTSDLGVGDPLPQGQTSVPTRKEWEGDFFWGITLDLRIATRFISKALSQGSASAR